MHAEYPNQQAALLLLPDIVAWDEPLKKHCENSAGR